LANPDGASAVPIFMLVAAVLLISAGYVRGENPLWSIEIATVLILWSAASGFAYLAWDVGMRRGHVVLISSVAMLIPLFSTIITCLITTLPLTIGIVGGSLCLVVGAATCKYGVED
jgi:drug/metabolite transporter (DMT)-like permease